MRNADLRNLQERADARAIRAQMLEIAKRRSAEEGGAIVMVPNPETGPDPWRPLRTNIVKRRRRVEKTALKRVAKRARAGEA